MEHYFCGLSGAYFRLAHGFDISNPSFWIIKIVFAQKERNKSIDHLVEVMDIYSFMQRQSLSYFIRGYAINKKFCISIFVCDSPKFVVYNSREQTVKHFMSDTDNRTKQYQTKFNELKHCR
jgi:hypothetical protein